MDPHAFLPGRSCPGPGPGRRVCGLSSRGLTVPSRHRPACLRLCGRQPSSHSSPGPPSGRAGRGWPGPGRPLGPHVEPDGSLPVPRLYLPPMASFLRACSVQRPGFTGGKTPEPKQPFHRLELGPEPLTPTLSPAHTSHAFLVENGDPGVCRQRAPLGRRELQEAPRVVPGHTVGWSGSTLCPQAGGSWQR